MRYRKHTHQKESDLEPDHSIPNRDTKGKFAWVTNPTLQGATVLLANGLMLILTIVILYYTITSTNYGKTALQLAQNDSTSKESIEQLKQIARSGQSNLSKQDSTNNRLDSTLGDLNSQLKYLAGILAGTNESNALNRNESLLRRKVSLEALVGYSNELNRVAMFPDVGFKGNSSAQITFLKSSDSLWILCLSNPVLLEDDILAKKIRNLERNVGGWLGAYQGANGQTQIITRFQNQTVAIDTSKARILKTFDHDFNNLINAHMNMLMEQLNPFIILKKQELGIPVGQNL